MEYYLEVQIEINPLLPKLLLVMVVITGTEINLEHSPRRKQLCPYLCQQYVKGLSSGANHSTDITAKSADYLKVSTLAAGTISTNLPLNFQIAQSRTATQKVKGKYGKTYTV